MRKTIYRKSGIIIYSGNTFRYRKKDLEFSYSGTHIPYFNINKNRNWEIKRFNQTNRIINNLSSYHDVIYRYKQYRVGRSIPFSNKLFFYNRTSNNKMLWHIYRSRFLYGWNNFLKNIVKIGQFIPHDGISSHSFPNAKSKKYDCAYMPPNYPVFIDIFNNKFNMRDKTYFFTRKSKKLNKRKTNERHLLKLQIINEMKDSF